MIRQEYDLYVRLYGADITIGEFQMLYWERDQDSRMRLPRGMDLAFLRDTSGNPAIAEIQALIRKHDAEQTSKLQQEVFAQRKRLADAERILQTKTTKGATESKRIATDKVSRAMARLADIQRGDAKDKDARIFPGWYAPVMVMENGRRVIKPMRYQCRPSGMPATFDRTHAGTYNARRDNLGGFWKDLFGYKHGIAVVNAFFENVSKHNMQGRALGDGEAEENVILEFRPQPAQDMLVACLWSAWEGDGQRLLSFRRHH